MINDKSVKIRKPHKCWGCTKEYPIGTIMRKTTSVDNGKILDAYWCETCEKVIANFEYPDDEPWGFGELLECYPKEAPNA